MSIDNLDFNRLSLGERLSAIRENCGGKIVFTTSFGIEDQLITHHILVQKLAIEIVTLDTGRLFEETQNLWHETEDFYGTSIKGFFPDAQEVSKFVRANGTNGFRNSVAARQKCCAIRKIEPLNQALLGAEIWITGLRANQSIARANISPIEQDIARGIHKFSPLFDYSRDAVVAEVMTLKIPYNPLHDSGFLSIGCAPCTRAIAPNEEERAGRWWWENAEFGKKECGLHVNESGILKPIKI